MKEFGIIREANTFDRFALQQTSKAREASRCDAVDGKINVRNSVVVLDESLHNEANLVTRILIPSILSSKHLS